MRRKLKPACILILALLYPCFTLAQSRISPKENNTLRLQLSSGFLTVVKLARIDLDSSLFIASKRDGLSRIPIITEDLELNNSLNDVTWMDLDDTVSAQKRLKQLKGKDHTRQLLLLGAYYAFHPGLHNKYISSAKFYLTRAKDECTARHLPRWNAECEILLGKCHMKEGNIPDGMLAFNQAISYANVSKEKKIEAKALNYEGMYCPYLPSTMLLRIGLLQKAVRLYKDMNDPVDQINPLMNIGYLSLAAGKLQVSEATVKESLILQDKAGFPYTHYSVDLLAFIVRLKGNYVDELKYAISEVRTAELSKDSLGLAYFYARVADSYMQDGNHVSETNVWFKKSLDQFVKYGGDPATYKILTSTTFIEYGLGGSKAVLKMLITLMQEYPPDNPVDRQSAYLVFATFYDNLKQFRIAEKYYLLAEKLEKTNRLMLMNINNGYVYYRLGGFYFRKGDFEKSKINTLKYITGARGVYVDSLMLTDAYWTLFQVDSAQGDFDKMRALYQYSIMKKRLITSAKNKLLEELNIRYQTLQKQRDLQIYKAKTLLEKQHTQTIRRLSYAGLIILFLIVIFIWLRYISKQRSTLQLQAQKDEIDRKNSQLQHVIFEKDELLLSKEWLLKEVHHRVKNNLQIVMSLLNSQTTYLKDEAALTAVTESRHRIQAMSLIHQKLYKSDNVSSISMEDYIKSLVEYLKDSFKTQLSIYFELQIEPINLDVSQAIPVGLILNELITNAIKYAFPHSDEDRITISFFKSAIDEISLIVADNGLGLPEEFDVLKTTSFGMKLVEGLAIDLDGHFLIESSNGTVVKMTFKNGDFYRETEENIFNNARSH